MSSGFFVKSADFVPIFVKSVISQILPMVDELTITLSMVYNGFFIYVQGPKPEFSPKFSGFATVNLTVIV